MKKKEWWKRYLAALLAFTMLMTQCQNVVYAAEIPVEQGEEPEIVPTEESTEESGEELTEESAEESTEELTEEPAEESEEEPKCICFENGWDCSQGPPLGYCPVCGGFDGSEIHIGDSTKCENICTCVEDGFSCDENVRNPFCPRCQRHPENCGNQLICICDFLEHDCNKYGILEDCLLCKEHPEKCIYQEPICVCMLFGWDCSKDGPNPDCLRCAMHPEHCDYKCICEEQHYNCEVKGANPDCPVCSIDSANCPYKEVCICKENHWDCSSDLTGWTECPVCKDGHIDLCEYKCICRETGWNCIKTGENNPDCPICSEDTDQCSYHCKCEELKSNCNKGGEDAFTRPMCPACREHPEECLYYCTCEQDDVICDEASINPNCPVCRDQGIKKCEYQCVCLFFEEGCTSDSYEADCKVCRRYPEKCNFQLDTAAKINKRIQDYPDEPLMIPCNSITSSVSMNETVEISGNTEFLVSKIDYNGKMPILERDSELDKPLFVVKNGAVLTLDHMAVSGATEYKTAQSPLIFVEAGGTLILRNGTSLTGNENQNGNGGAIYSEGKVVLSDSVVITGNEAVLGGGIYLGADGELLVSGSPMIVENKSGGEANNLYLSQNAKKVQLEGLTDGAQIGITMEKNGAFAEGGNITNLDQKAFSSDQGYFIAAKDNMLLLNEEEDIIVGRILWKKQAVSKAQVVFADKDNGSVLCEAVSDKDGFYKIPQFAEKAACKVLVTAEQEGKSYAAISNVVVDPNEETEFEDIELEEGSIVSGILSGETEGVTVSAWTVEGKEEGTTSTYGNDENSRYDMLVKGELLSVIAKNSDNTCSGSFYFETVPSGMVQADMLVKKGIVAVGKVVDTDNKPVAGAKVSFTGGEDSPAYLSEEVIEKGNDALSAITDEQGVYRIAGAEISEDEKSRFYFALILSSEWETAAPVMVAVVKPDAGEGNDAKVMLPAGEENGEPIYVDEPIALTQRTMEVSGTVHYDCGTGEKKVPQGAKLAIYLDKSKVVEADIDSQTGAFTLQNVIWGNYRAVLEIGEESYGMETSDFWIGEDGNIRIAEGSRGFMQVSGENAILIQPPEAVSDYIQKYEKLEDSKDMSDEEKEAWIEVIENRTRVVVMNQKFKMLNGIEKDMIPKALQRKLDDWMAYLRSRYKITVQIRKAEVFETLDTNLGNGEDATETAKEIAMEAIEDEVLSGEGEVALVLDTKTADSEGKRVIDSAIQTSLEDIVENTEQVVAYFDADLLAEYQDAEGTERQKAITETSKMIELSVSLEEDWTAGAEYVVLRSHGQGENQKVDVLRPADLKDGTFKFSTDRFSTYAIAYARPGKGIIVKPLVSDKPSDDEEDSEGNGNGDGKPEKPEEGGNTETDGGEGKPNKPEKPSKPNKPEKPSEPNKPEKPSEPEKPSKPEKPEEGGNTGTNGEEVKPEKPNKPEKPEEGGSSGTNGTDEKPNKPTKPEEGGNTGTDGENIQSNQSENGNKKPSAEADTGENKSNGSSKKEGGESSGDGNGQDLGKNSGQKVTKMAAHKKYQGDEFDSQYHFWLSVEEKILKAEDGDIIEVDCANYELLPAMVINALAGKDVTLILNGWNGKQIVLNGKKLVPQKNVTYYDYERLEELMKMTEETQPSEGTQVLDGGKETSLKKGEKDVEAVLEQIEKKEKKGHAANVAAAVAIAGVAAALFGVLILRKRNRKRIR